MSEVVRIVLLLAVLAVWPVRSAAQETTFFLSSNEVTDLAVGVDAVHWSSRGGAGGFWPGDSLYTELTSADGLGSNHLTAVAVDSSGSVWYGTEQGGVRWVDSAGQWHVINTYAGLPSNRITSLDAWGEGVWVGTAVGASYFSGDTHVETEASGQGLLSGAVLAVLVEDAGSVWFGTEHGLSLRTDDGWEEHFVGVDTVEVRALSLDRHGVLWVVTDAGVHRRSDAAWTPVSAGLPDPDAGCVVLAGSVLWVGTQEGPAWFDEAAGEWVPETEGLPGRWVTSLGFGSELGLWAGIWEEGLAWWDGEAWRPRRPSSPASNYLSDLAVDPRGDLWCATGTDNNLFTLPSGISAKGILHFAGQVWTEYRKTNSPLPRDNAYRVAGDTRGGVWIGTWGSGLLRLDPVSGAWDTLSIATGDLFSNHISALVPGRMGEVWFTEYVYSLGGIAVVDTNGVVTHFGQSDGLPTVYFRSLAVDSLGCVWAGSYGIEGSTDLPSLTRLDHGGTLAEKADDEVTVYSATLWGGSVPVHALACTPEGGVWLGVESGVAWTDGGQWVPVGEACAGSATGQVRSIAVDRTGGVWFATLQGLAEWRDETLTLHDAAGGGLAADEIMSLAYDGARHTLWVGTWGGGVSRWVFEVPDSGDRAALYAYPNPFRPDEGHEFITFHGLAPGAELKIYTLVGQEVVTLPPGAEVWDAATRDGEPVASGLYIFAGKDERGSVRSGKVAVIR